MQAATPPDDGDKKAWRRRLRERLRSVPDAGSQAASILRHLELHLAALPDSRLAAFAAMPGEVDLRPLVRASRHAWHFPRIDGDHLVFHRVSDPDDLEPDAYGIDAPRPDHPRIDVEDFDVFLVPGLGFTRDGSRLGRGKGYYDRVLTRARPGAPLIGIAFREQLADHLPTDAHDIPVNHLLTADGLELVAPGT